MMLTVVGIDLKMRMLRVMKATAAKMWKLSLSRPSRAPVQVARAALAVPAPTPAAVTATETALVMMIVGYAEN